MKKPLMNAFTFVIAATLTTAAIAGVKETKVMRAADSKISNQLAQTQASCDNSNLTVDMGWQAFIDMTDKNKAALAKKRYLAIHLMHDVGARTHSVLEALEKICVSDVDYKEEIVTLKSIKIIPKPTAQEYRSSFEIADGVITVTTGYYMTRNADDYILPLKELF